MKHAFAITLLAVTIAPAVAAHPGHKGLHPTPARTLSVAPADAVSGQGVMRFRVLYASDRLPAEARDVLADAHGGFAVDRRAGKGEAYFALPGAGILRISSDLQSIDLLDTEAAVRDTNLHNTTLWEAADGTPYLTFPANDAGRVFTTTLDGELVHTLEPPAGELDLGHETVNAYFDAGKAFVPTDVDELRGRLYVTTGYSDLDWVLTARVRSATPLDIRWHDLSFGGRGTDPGQFGTGHGVTIVHDGKGRVDIADRPNGEIDRFTPDGAYLSTVNLPEGSWPCDIDYLDDYAVVGALYGPDHDKGAPVYVLDGDRVISEIWPKDELGLTNFQHIHNATFHRVEDRFYILVQSWNPGDFAVLEQVTD